MRARAGLIEQVPDRHPSAEGEPGDRVVAECECVDELADVSDEKLLRERPVGPGAVSEAGMVRRYDAVPPPA